MTSEIGKRGGFTLIELLVTGIVIGLLAAVVWPSLYRSSARRKIQLETAAFVSRLEQTRLKAVRTATPRTNEEEAVTFYPDGSSRAFRKIFEGPAGEQTEVTVDETGRIRID